MRTNVKSRRSRINLANRCLSPDACEAVATLRASQESQIPSNSLGQYQVAIDNLEACYSLVALSRSEIEPRCIFVWLYHLHDDLILDLSARRPQALLIIAYFSVFLASIEENTWYLKGWARQLLDQVVTHFEGQPGLLELIKWPRKQVFELLGGECARW